MAIALDKPLAASAGGSLGKSASHAAARLMRRPGLTSTSPHRRLATGRAQGPATRPSRATENGPSKLTRMGAGPRRTSPAGAGTNELCHCSAAGDGGGAPLSESLPTGTDPRDIAPEMSLASGRRGCRAQARVVSFVEAGGSTFTLPITRPSVTALAL